MAIAVKPNRFAEKFGYPNPTGRAITKVKEYMTAYVQDFIRHAPFMIMATSDQDGHCDASPKGDPAGHLIHVLDSRTIVIAERPGNKRADGYLNVLANPHVGIISLIPGRNDTLRINGRARLVADAPFFDDLAVRGQRPVLALVVEIDEVFSHCPKAFMRSEIWEPSTWKPDALPSTAALCKAVLEPAETLEELEAYYAPESYVRQLY